MIHKEIRKLINIAGKVTYIATLDCMSDFLGHCVSKKDRKISEYAEQEIYVPTGRFAGRKFKIDRQPFARFWFDAIDSNKWVRYAAVGCTQSGKTLIGFVIPIMYHIFELEETIAVGVPEMNTAGEKWRYDILPVIEKTQYLDYLPTSGRGSKGGVPIALSMKNGVVLKFLSAGGGDKQRAHFQTRVLCATEINGYDETGNSSQETDKLSQMEARTLSHGAMGKRVYLECTQTIETGRINVEYEHGTKSKIVCVCPSCKKDITPERNNLRGWQTAKNKIQAYNESYYECPYCLHKITDEERKRMNQNAKLVHQNNPDETDTFSLRWNAFNNMFWTPGDVGIEEWKRKNESNEHTGEEMERKLCQFYWSVPYTPPNVSIVRIDGRTVNKRRNFLRKGQFPEWADIVTIGIDLHKRVGYWLALAQKIDGKRSAIIDYGTFEINSDALGIERGTLNALRDFDEYINQGFFTNGGERKLPDQIWIDSGYSDSASSVYEFVLETGQDLYHAIKGFGKSSEIKTGYHEPSKMGNKTIYIGNSYFINYLEVTGIHLISIDVDIWKTRALAGLGCDAFDIDGKLVDGAITLFSSAKKSEHKIISEHFTSESAEEKFKPGEGVIIKWVKKSKSNHWLDCLVYALSAADFIGIEYSNQAADEGDNEEYEVLEDPYE